MVQWFNLFVSCSCAESSPESEGMVDGAIYSGRIAGDRSIRSPCIDRVRDKNDGSVTHHHMAAARMKTAGAKHPLKPVRCLGVTARGIGVATQY